MTENKKKTLLNIQSHQYEYPPEREAIHRLNIHPTLKTMSLSFIREIAEPWLNGELTGNCVKLSKKQIPQLFSIAENVASMLYVPMPQVFLQQNPFLNSFTHGAENQNFLVITHSLYEQIDEECLYFIIGHEMGHIKNQHVLYTSIIQYLLQQQELTKRKEHEELLLTMLDWQRKSEFTADRVGLLICQDIDIACKSLLTMAIGSKKLADQVDINDYVENQLLSLEYNPVGQESQLYQSHPFIPVRMKELMNFYNSQQYKDIINCADSEIEIELK